MFTFLNSYLINIISVISIFCVKYAVSNESMLTCLLQKINLDVSHYRILEFTNFTFTHAESPVWDDQTHILYWVDVLNHNVHSLDYNTGVHRVKHIEYGEINIVLPVAGSRRLLLGVRSQIYLLDWDKPGDSGLKFIAALDRHTPDNILNEGKADAKGRFWGGTKGPQKGDTVISDEAALYSMEQPWFTPQVQLKPVSISNGLVWSLNNSVMYYIDSATRKIEAFNFDLARGHISNRRTILDIKQHGYENAIADGMTIDRDDQLWVALMFNGTIIRINPNTGSITEKYRLPVSRTTSVTWAGTNMDQLIVTTSRRNMDEKALAQEPLSGAIFVLHNMGTGGVPNYKFAFDAANQF